MEYNYGLGLSYNEWRKSFVSGRRKMSLGRRKPRMGTWDDKAVEAIDKEIRGILLKRIKLAEHVGSIATES